MCLLIVKTEKAVIPSAYLQAASKANPHGCGIAWSDGGKVYAEKSPKWGHLEIAERLAKLGDVPAIIHFRFATHGSMTAENTHPFPLPRGIFAAHNGVISGQQMKGDESDTRAFLRVHVAPWIKKGVAPDSKTLLDHIELQMGGGNKIAMLAPDGRYSIAGESLGHWHSGAWYSNESYKARREYGYEYRSGRSTWSPGRRKLSRWTRLESTDLCCTYCRENITSLAFGSEFLFDPVDMEFCCQECAPFAESMDW